MPAGYDNRFADRSDNRSAGWLADGTQRPYPEGVGSHMFITPRGRLRSKAWRICSAH